MTVIMVQYVIAGTMGSCSRPELQANHSGYIIDALKGYRQ